MNKVEQFIEVMNDVTNYAIPPDFKAHACRWQFLAEYKGKQRVGGAIDICMGSFMEATVEEIKACRDIPSFAIGKFSMGMLVLADLMEKDAAELRAIVKKLEGKK